MSESRAVTFGASDGLVLEGVLHLPAATPAPGIAVCHPHPLYGGDMNNNVVSVICRAAAENGVAALRFNFRGTGRSEGRHEGGDGERLDVAAAAEYLRGLPEIDSERVAVAGYSFGAAVALTANLSGLRALAAVSAPATSLPPQPSAALCPLLLVSGDEDEYSDEDDIAGFARATGAAFVIVPGADHFWCGNEDRLVETVGEFLRKYLV